MTEQCNNSIKHSILVLEFQYLAVSPHRYHESQNSNICKISVYALYLQTYIWCHIPLSGHTILFHWTKEPQLSFRLNSLCPFASFCMLF